MSPNRMAPMLWLALKPTHAFHIVVSRVSTGDVTLMLARRDGSRGVSFGPEKVYTRCTTPSARMMTALTTMRAREIITAQYIHSLPIVLVAPTCGGWNDSERGHLGGRCGQARHVTGAERPDL